MATPSPDGTRIPSPGTDKDGHVWEIRLGQGSIPPSGTPPTDGVAIWRDGELTNGVAIDIWFGDGIAYFHGRNLHWWISLGKDSQGRWAWQDNGPDDPSKVVIPPPPPTTTLPTSADFAQVGSDPRGGDAGYAYVPKTADGKGILFRNFSHDEAGNNAVCEYDPAKNVATQLVANTKWPGGTIVTGLPFLGNSDNGPQIVVKGELWALTGQRGPTLTGNYNGVLPLAAPTWIVNDTAGAFPRIANGEPHGHQDGAVGAVGTTVYMIGGWEGGNPSDTIDLIDASGAAPYTAKRFNGYPGAVVYRYCSHNHWVRNGKIRVYGPHQDPVAGTMTGHNELREIDISGAQPLSTLISTNNLTADVRVQGEAILCWLDEASGFEVMTDGVHLNVHDPVADVWANVTINGGDDVDRHSPTSQGSGLAGFYASGKFNVLGSHGKIFAVTLNFGTTPPPPVTTDPPPVTTDPPPVIVVTPPPPAGSVVTATSVLVVWNDSFSTNKKAKHGQGLFMGDNNAYYCCKDASPLSFPAAADGSVDGNPEMWRFLLPQNKMDIVHPYWLPDANVKQITNTDDSFMIRRNRAAIDQLFFFFSISTLPYPYDRPSPTTGGPWAQHIPLTHVAIYTPTFAGGDPRWGTWTDGGPIPPGAYSAIHGDNAWRGYDDPVNDCFIIPCNCGGQTGFVVLRWDGTKLIDLTNYGKDDHGNQINGNIQNPDGSYPKPWSYGEFRGYSNGFAVDPVSRNGYLLDTTNTDLGVVNIDAIYNRAPNAYPQIVASLGTTGLINDQYGGKIDWDPDIQGVVAPVHENWKVYLPSNRSVSTIQRQDGRFSDYANVNNVPTFVGTGKGPWTNAYDTFWDERDRSHITHCTIDFNHPTNDSLVRGWYRTKFRLAA